jgi:hypothetical protein
VILRVFFSEEPMQRLGREQWIELISEYKKSGLTQKEFAARHQVSHNAIQFWLYKLRREADQSRRFLPVSVVASPAPKARQTTSGWVEAMLPSGLRLRFEVGTDVRYLGQLFAALAS